MSYDIFESMFSISQRRPDYEECLKQMDDFIEEMQLMYLSENHSPSSALIYLGFEENKRNEHRYEYEFDGGFHGIVDFYEFDMNDGMIKYYVTDEHGMIPQGYCATKVELKEPEMYEGISYDAVPSDFMEKAFDRVYGSMEDTEPLNEDYANFPRWLVDALNSAGGVVKRTLTNKGVDLANATYIKADFPRSNRDPVLKDNSRISIFRLDDHGSEKVYIKGYNNPFIASYGDYGRHCDEMPIRGILDITTEYGYIDLNDSRNSNVQKRLDRKLLDRSTPNDVKRGKGQYLKITSRYNNETDKFEDTFAWVMTQGEDKSGYPLDPDKYIKKLDSVGFDNYGDRLESYYKKVESLRSRLIPLITKFDIKDPSPNGYKSGFVSSSAGVFSDLASALTDFSNAVGGFQQLKRNIDGAVNCDDKEEAALGLRLAFRYDATKLRNYIKDCEKLLKKLESVDISAEE